jgi:hypothetical protein
MPTSQCKAVNTVTKTKYNVFAQALKETCNDPELMESILLQFRTIFGFDPKATSYTKEKGQHNIARRKELAQQEGVSTYVKCGGKKLYERRKVLRQELVV